MSCAIFIPPRTWPVHESGKELPFTSWSCAVLYWVCCPTAIRLIFLCTQDWYLLSEYSMRSLLNCSQRNYAEFVVTKLVRSDMWKRKCRWSAERWARMRRWTKFFLFFFFFFLVRQRQSLRSEAGRRKTNSAAVQTATQQPNMMMILPSKYHQHTSKRSLTKQRE